MMRKRRQLEVVQPAAQPICLGLIVVPMPGQAESTIEALGAFPQLELGELQEGGLPACIITAIGDDKALLRDIEALPSVLSTEVVYAQSLTDEDLS
jgi:nitrate reductase NapAB chaperone NapD